MEILNNIIIMSMSNYHFNFSMLLKGVVIGLLLSFAGFVGALLNLFNVQGYTIILIFLLISIPILIFVYIFIKKDMATKESKKEGKRRTLL